MGVLSVTWWAGGPVKYMPAESCCHENVEIVPAEDDHTNIVSLTI